MNNNLPIRVLQISYSMDLGGAETLIMNLYRNIDRTKVQFDFLLHSEKESSYDKEILKLGGRIYRIPRFLGYNKLSYDKNLREFLSEHPEHKIIHDHLMDSASETFRVAKEMGRITIAHSHTADVSPSISEMVRAYFRKDLYKRSDYRFACSEKAGKWLYRDKADFKVLNNAIDTASFRFSDSERKKIRKELGISDDSFLVGTVGRMAVEKNQLRLLEIFKNLLNEKKNARLLIVGDGPLYKELKERVNKLGIDDYVIFTGSRSDVPSLLSGMDSFVLTSFNEGLGIVLIEAMASGLPCVFTSTIPQEVNISPYLVHRVSLDAQDSDWVKEILSSKALDNREEGYEIVKNKGFDIKSVAKEMEE
ncbi:MAG: glycosyltransferase, partial [Candidatus Ornithospirochaeta sp.]